MFADGAQERGMTERASGSWRASPRGHQDRNDRGQEPDEEGAQQHRIEFYWGDTEVPFSEPSDSVRIGLTGAHQHLLPVHLVRLVVNLDQVEFGANTGIERLCMRTGGSCHHPAPSQLTLLLAFGSRS